MQTAQHGFDDIIDEHRLKARIRLRQRKRHRQRREQACEPIQKGVPGAEHDRRLKDGPVQRGASFAERSDLTITMVTNDAALLAVFEGPDGILAADNPKQRKRARVKRGGETSGVKHDQDTIYRARGC